MSNGAKTDREEAGEREIRELKEIILGLTKGVEWLAEGVKENSASQRREEFGTLMEWSSI